MNPLIPAAATGGSNIASSLIQRGTQNRINQDQMNHNRFMAQFQNDLNIENWMRQNAYNTPAMQMERLKAAGLSPHLMYGKGTVGNAEGIKAASATPARLQTPPPVNLGVAEGIQTYQNIAMQKEQIDLVKEQVAQMRQENLNKAVTNEILGLKRDKMQWDYDGRFETREWNRKFRGLKWEVEKFDYFKSKESWPHQLQFMQLKNNMFVTQRNKMLQEILNLQTLGRSLGEDYKVKAARAWWNQYKNQIMEDRGLNIDNTDAWDKLLLKGGSFFEDWQAAWKFYNNRFKP